MSEFSEKKEKHYKYGSLLGYPNCCIDSHWLLSLEKSGDDTDRKLYGTGFYPCDKCNSSKTENEMIDEINKNRRYKLDFPLLADALEVLSPNLKKEVLKELEAVIKHEYKHFLDIVMKKFSYDIAILIIIDRWYQTGILNEKDWFFHLEIFK